MSEKPLYTMADFVARYHELVIEYWEGERPCERAFNQTNAEYKDVYGVFRFKSWAVFRMAISRRRAKNKMIT